MKIILGIIAIIFIMLAVFTAANWQVLTTPAPLSFVAFSIEGPLGVMLLGVSLLLTLLVVVYALLLRTTWLMESRRINRQLEEQRELAEKAESSRISALIDLIERKFNENLVSNSEVSKTMTDRIELMELNYTQKIEDVASSIMAHLGYLDDKLKK